MIGRVHTIASAEATAVLLKINSHEHASCKRSPRALVQVEGVAHRYGGAAAIVQAAGFR